MRWDDFRRSDNVEDDREGGGGFGGGGGFDYRWAAAVSASVPWWCSA